ncbi:uncharacterized protein A4U43_C08F24640 [Asparagus officinalis]|nr:uncharacterized protein A4U43_C08F24640 [Asparagus officinalis]
MYNLEGLLMAASAETLGRGTVGSTYKAVMESGFIVMVKRLKDSGSLGVDEFRRRMEKIGWLRHPNLVLSRAYFQAKEERLLVHDYLWEPLLFDSWIQRIRAIDTICRRFCTRLQGWNGEKGEFELKVKRSVGLVNKGLEYLKDELLIPGSWLAEELRNSLIRHKTASPRNGKFSSIGSIYVLISYGSANL